MSERIREVHGFQCLFCGEIYPTRKEAEQCWDRHINYEFEPYYSMNSEYPTEILVKKIEGDRYTEIATYELKKVEKVDLPVKVRKDVSENDRKSNR